MSGKAALKQFFACLLSMFLAMGTPSQAATIVSGFPSGPGGLWSGGLQGSFSSTDGITARWSGTFGAAQYNWVGGITPGTSYEINFTTNISQNPTNAWGPVYFGIGQGQWNVYMSWYVNKALFSTEGVFNNDSQFLPLGTFPSSTTPSPGMYSFAATGGVPWKVAINGSGQATLTNSLTSGSWSFTVPQGVDLGVGVGNGYRGQGANSSVSNFSITSIDPVSSTTYTSVATTNRSAILVGGTASITATVTNTGTGTADSLAVTGLGVNVSPSGSVSSFSPTSGTAAQAGGTVSGSGGFTAATAGLYTFTPSVTSATNATIGGAATATGTTTATVTVLDPGLASFSGGSTQTSLSIDFGTVNKDDIVSPQSFSLYDLVQTAGYTADLALVGIAAAAGNSGLLGTTLTTFSTLPSGSSNSWQAEVYSTAFEGTFTDTWTLEFKSSNSGTVLAGAASQFLTLTTSVVVVPEPGTMALAGIGVIVVGAAAKRRRRS